MRRAPPRNQTQAEEFESGHVKDRAVANPIKEQPYNTVTFVRAAEPLQGRSKKRKQLKLTRRELEDSMDPPNWTGRRLFKIDEHIRLVIKMLTDLEKHTRELQRLSPTAIDEMLFDNVVWEMCLTRGFLFDQFDSGTAYAEHYLSAEEPDMDILQSLYSSELVTHRVVCLPKRGSDIEGAWSLDDDFFFERFDNGISPFKSRNTRLPLDFFLLPN